MGVVASSAWPRPALPSTWDSGRLTVCRHETGSPLPPAASQLRSTSAGTKAWAAGDTQRHMLAPEICPEAVTETLCCHLRQSLYTSGLCSHLVPRVRRVCVC